MVAWITMGIMVLQGHYLMEPTAWPAAGSQ